MNAKVFKFANDPFPRLLQHMPSMILTKYFEDGGCGTVDRAVASESRGPEFKWSRRLFMQNIIITFC